MKKGNKSRGDTQKRSNSVKKTNRASYGKGTGGQTGEQSGVSTQKALALKSGVVHRKPKNYEIFKVSESQYLCPHCFKSFKIDERGSFRCSAGHCFDISAKGYINFIPSLKSEKYSKQLFECRQRIFGRGFYQRVVSEIRDIITVYTDGNEPFSLLDAGCGEGYYCQELSRLPALRERCEMYGIDIVREAIQIAARSNESVNWIVADLTRIPIKRKRIDVLLNVLTPANYSEFSRVLKDDGILIKVIPGDRYLSEIRQGVAEQLKNKDYSNQRVITYFEEHYSLTERREVCYTLPLGQEDLEDFLQMTPMTFHVDLSKVNPDAIKEITIHMEILVGRKKEVFNAYDIGEKELQNGR